MKKSCKRQPNENFGFKKQSGEKEIDCTSNGRAMVTHSIIGLI